MCGDDLLGRIVGYPAVLGGKPVIRGTRVSVDLVLELPAHGMAPEDIVEDYKVAVDDVRAVLLYAARALRSGKN